MTRKKSKEKVAKRKMTQRSRNWCFTLNNWTLEEQKQIHDYPCKYMIVAEEICPTTGTPHLQGYIELPNGMTMSALKKKIGNTRIHFETRKGDSQQASDYCRFDDYPTNKTLNKYFEKGIMSAPGTRTDLESVNQAIAAGTMTVEDILEDNPTMYHQYGRTLEKLQDMYNRRRIRTWTTKGIWYYGPTGTGKSHTAFKGFNHETHYVWNPDDNGWWDGYTGQEIVIINEFRGQLPYGRLLDLVDNTPYVSVKRRGREPTVFLAKTVIITSSLHPKEVYHNLSEHDSLSQLDRRFNIILMDKPYKAEITQRCSEGNTEPLSNSKKCLIA